MFHRGTQCHVTYVISVCVILACLVGCESGQPVRTADSTALAPSVPASTTEELPIILTQSGTYSRIGRAIRVVIRDEAQFAQLSLADIPVDFKTQMVLVIGLGPTPTNQVGTHIARVWRESNRIRVQERQLWPDSEHSATGIAPASPWTLVVVPRSDLNVEGFVGQVPRGVLHDRTTRIR